MQVVTHHSSCFSWHCSEFQNAYTAQAFVFCDKPVDADVIVVAFRGTRPFDAARWCADLDPSWYKIPRLGRAHAAYTHALGAQRNIGWPKWVEHIKGKPQKVKVSIFPLGVSTRTPRAPPVIAGTRAHPPYLTGREHVPARRCTRTTRSATR